MDKFEIGSQWKTRGGWMNMHTDMPQISGSMHKTRENADKYDNHNRVACIPIEFVEGEGL